jgi:hypothetical protein
VSLVSSVVDDVRKWKRSVKPTKPKKKNGRSE